MSGDDATEWVFFRIARPVAVDSHEGIAECNWARNPLDNRLSNFRAGYHGQVRLESDNMVAFVSFLPTLVRCG